MSFDGLALAQVVRFHPHDNSLDCQLHYDGGRLTGVPILSPAISSSSGRVDPHAPEGVDWDSRGSPTRNVVAVLGSVGGNPVVVGFLAPAVSQVLFGRQNFRVDRHPSDVYSTIDQDGNIELAHPSGSFIRMAASPSHEDLTGKDYDKKWVISRNTTQRVWLSVSIANGGSEKASVQIDPDGNVAVAHAGSLTVSTSGSTTLAASSLVINAPVAINGASLTHNGVNVGATHVHGGIDPGGSNTSSPS